MAIDANDDFFSTLPAFDDFDGVTDVANYHGLPDGWFLAIADIVGSTRAIQAGRYKDVNMAGAAVISAVLNAVGAGDYPFAFGGDGAMIALPASFEAQARLALAALATWTREDLDLTMRVALVPVGDVRAAGQDVRIARYSASPNVSYAMFSGGGVTWAEQRMKAGEYAVLAAPVGARPDLTGLSCRWSPIQSVHGEIVSIIALPTADRATPEFRRLVSEVVAIASEAGRGGHPVPEEGPDLAFSLAGIEREVRATSDHRGRLYARLSIFLQLGLTIILHKLGFRLGRFDARRYKADVAANSDFRKFDDGLRMTIDVDAARLSRIQTILEDAQAKGHARFGLHSQSSALMTCFVPTPLSRDHMHFIDGADGGYAMAAAKITGKLDCIAPGGAANAGGA